MGGTCTCWRGLRDKYLPGDVRAEARTLITLAVPIVSLTLMQYFIMMTAIIFCGHIGKVEMDAVSLASSMVNVFGMAVSLGLVEGYETLFTQAYGSGNKTLMGIYLQRSLVLHVLAFLLCLSILINVEGLCVLFGQDRQIAAMTGEYMNGFMPGVFCTFMYTILSRYLQDMNDVMSTVVVTIIGNVINIAAHFTFITGLGMGIEGSAYAVSLSYLSMLILIIVYMLCSTEFKATWPGLSADMWRDWGAVLKLAVPALVSLCLEWWTFEITIFLTGVLGATELGAQTLCLNVDTVAFYILSGLGITATIRVGQHLGAGDVLAAKTACFTVLLITLVPVIITVIVLLSLSGEIPKIFTNVPDIIELSSRIIPLVALYQLCTGVTTWTNGVFRGSGRQYLAAASFFCAFYIFCLPVGCCLMFLTPLRTVGLWISLVVGLFIAAVIMTVFVLQTNWQHQVERAAKNTSYEVADKITDDSETTALLGNTRMVDGPKTPPTSYTEAPHLLLAKDIKPIPSEKAQHDDSVVPDHKTNDVITSVVPGSADIGCSLVLRRTLAVVGVLLCLGLAVFIRVTVQLPPLPQDTPLNTTVTLTPQLENNTSQFHIITSLTS